MADVMELRVALTVQDFAQALAFYRDALGLEQVADWSSEAGRVVALDAGRATLELFDNAQAEMVDAVEAGRRVSGTVRLAVPGRQQRGHGRAARGGGRRAGRPAGHHPVGRSQRPGPGPGRDAADPVRRGVGGHLAWRAGTGSHPPGGDEYQGRGPSPL